MEDKHTPSFRIRAATIDDVEAVTNLINACEIVDHGVPDWTLEEMREEWQGLNTLFNGWVALAPNGALAGYAEFLDKQYVRFRTQAYVHPDWCGHGLGTRLVRHLEEQARPRIPQAPPGTRVSITNIVAAANVGGPGLLEQEGYTRVRSTWVMTISLDQPPAPPQWPPGITVRTFIPGQDDHAVHAAVEEAFLDHWGHLPSTLETWRQRNIERESFDPTLWFLACDGDEIAGASLCGYYMDTEGWVDSLSVRRPWRRQGIGVALLRHSFGEFYRRGKGGARLGVDTQSLTGATRLYEQVGMQVDRRYDTFEKELRPGNELGAVQ